MEPETSQHNGTNKGKSALDTDQLRTFCDVYVSKNFTQSAANLGVTESTVSYRIREMEKFFEKKLFNRRTNKTLEPTEFGVSFFPEAQNILAIVRKHKSLDSEGELAGTVKVSAGEIGGVYLLPPVIRAFESKFKNIKINIDISNSLKTLKKLSESECDLGVTASVDFKPNPYLKNVEVTKLLKLTFGVVVPVKHPLSKMKSLKVADLIGLPYISRDSYSGSHREILKIFEEGGISEDDLNIVWRFDNSSSVINAVAEGLGISIVNYVPASRYVQAGLVEFIPLDSKVESYLNLLDHWKGTNQVVNTFINFLKYYVATIKPVF
ncbi:MAG: LysR family transcriptional regulator [Candidatus Thermoplasmatota archaeon]|nr:LysR family transcriptional regulator [Candidatus Thermoplasmatota archaeon]